MTFKQLPARVLRGLGRGVRRLNGDERGAGVMWFALFVVLGIIGGVMVIDYGDIAVDRRDQQKSADLIALAGVQDLPEDTVQADLFAREWGIRNGVAPSEIVNLTLDNTCWNDHPDDDPTQIDSITVDVSRPANLFLASEFGIAFDVGAHAKACVGSLREAEGLRPWSISILNTPCFRYTGDPNDPPDDPERDDPFNYEPLYGEECVIRLESPSSQVGSIRLGDDPGDECDESGGGASKYVENIEEGSDAVCEIGGYVDTEPGLQVGPTLTALHNLLSTEGACDSAAWGDGDGIDQLLEVFTVPGGGPPSPETVFVPLDCGWDDDPGTPDSPRFVTLVLIDEFDSPNGFGTEQIIAFAGFYIQGCEVVDGEVVTAEYPKCDVPNGDQSNVQIVGTFIQYLQLGGPGGPLNPFGVRIYALVE